MTDNRPSWDLPIETQKEGMQRNIPRRNYELTGRAFHLVMDDGETYHLSIVDDATALWGRIGEAAGLREYQCMRANEFVWMVCFFQDDKSSITLVLDTLNQLATMLLADVGMYVNRPKVVRHQFTFGAIKVRDQALNMKRHHFTMDLVGKKIAWKYSTVVTITHIYQDAFTMRSSLNDMEPLPDTATDEQRVECKNRKERWSRIFFDEPCSYIKINDDLYLVAFIETNRNRVDDAEGGGDLLAIIDTKRVHDVGRVFGLGPDGKARLNLLTASGRFVDKEDELEMAKSPYWI